MTGPLDPHMLGPNLDRQTTVTFPLRCNMAYMTRERLKRKTTDHMTLIESSPKRVIAYFGDLKVSYAANLKGYLPEQ